MLSDSLSLLKSDHFEMLDHPSMVSLRFQHVLPGARHFAEREA